MEAFANFGLACKARSIIGSIAEIQSVQFPIARFCVVRTLDDFFVEEAMTSVTFGITTADHLKGHMSKYSSFHHVLANLCLNGIFNVLLIDNLESNFVISSCRKCSHSLPS